MTPTPSLSPHKRLQQDTHLRVRPGTPRLEVERARSLPPRSLTPSRGSPIPSKPVIRKRLSQYHTPDDVVKLLKASNNIVVLTGAGISTSLGIPDFRSKQGGFYSILADQGMGEPEEFFHIDNFYNDPRKFWETARIIIPGAEDMKNPAPRYSLTHAFLALLQNKGKLLTNYTQNIDGLESAAGVPDSNLVRCHGSWETATCVTCGKKKEAAKYLPVVWANSYPVCKCHDIESSKSQRKRPKSQPGRKRKRAEWEDSSDEQGSTEPERGLFKPDITFFGEAISNKYAPRLEDDKEKVDLLLIIGTSLKVKPVSELLLEIPPEVPQIWISRDRCQVGGVSVDIELLGDCDVIIGELCRRANWPNALRNRLWRPSSGLKSRDSSTASRASQTKPRAAATSTQSTDRTSRASRRNDANDTAKSDAHLQPSRTTASMTANRVVDSPLQGRLTTTATTTTTTNNAPIIAISDAADQPTKQALRSSTPMAERPIPHTLTIRQTEVASINSSRSASPSTKAGAGVAVEFEREEGTDWRWLVKKTK